MRVRTPLVIFSLFVLLALAHAGGKNLPRSPSQTPERLILSLQGREILAEIANTDAKRIRGLSGRTQLGANEGMLFIFPRAERYGFWMKDMAFPLDIIWLNDGEPQTDADLTQTYGEGRKRLVVVDIREDVAPETFPEVFYPREKARYVLEARSGFAKIRGGEIGDVITVEQEKTRR